MQLYERTGDDETPPPRNSTVDSIKYQQQGVVAVDASIPSERLTFGRANTMAEKEVDPETSSPPRPKQIIPKTSLRNRPRNPTPVTLADPLSQTSVRRIVTKYVTPSTRRNSLPEITWQLQTGRILGKRLRKTVARLTGGYYHFRQRSFQRNV